MVPHPGPPIQDPRLQLPDHGDTLSSGIARKATRRGNLSGDQENMVRLAGSKMDVDYLVTCMHDFMISQLTKPAHNPSTNLKEFLGYFNDLNFEDWWEEFPEGLELRHTRAVYEVLHS